MKYFLLLMLLLFLNSCEKEVYKITVKGKITDATTGEPLKNAKVKLIYSEPAMFGSTPEEAGKAETNENGDYVIKFRPLKESRRYFFEVEKEKYIFSEYSYIEYDNSEDERNYEGSFALFPESIIELHFNNISPYDENDALTCYLTFLKSGKPGIIFTKDTKDIKEVKSQIIPGNQFVKIEWTVKKNKISTDYKDSVFCQPFQTTKFEIKY